MMRHVRLVTQSTPWVSPIYSLNLMAIFIGTDAGDERSEEIAARGAPATAISPGLLRGVWPSGIGTFRGARRADP